MKTQVINSESLLRVAAIHKLSQEHNKNLGNDHTLRLIELAQEHTEEIRQLFQDKNDHYLIETGDLVILCLEVLLENNKSIDEVLTRCFQRYEKKLPELLRVK